MRYGCVNGAKGLYTVPSGSGAQFSDGVAAVAAAGCTCLKAYCTGGYAADYPLHTWSSAPASLAQLADTTEFRAALSNPQFSDIVLTCFSFANGSTNWWRVDPSNARLAAEYAERFALAQYLLTQYNNSGKTFVLQNWEGDWAYADSFTLDTPVDRMMRSRYAAFLAVCQRAVQDARAATAHTNVRVLNAIEVNRVLDSRHKPHRRTIMRDLARLVTPDVVSYSAYDSTIVTPPVGWAGTYGQWAAACAQYFTQALSIIKSAWPGVPLQVGEFGFPENEAPGGFDVGAMIEVVHGVALAAGVERFIYWQAFDNEGPDAAHCRGYWFVRPDGTQTFAGAKFATLR